MMRWVGDGIADRPMRGASVTMTAPDLVNLSALIDDAKCFALVRQQRWPEGVRCPACGSGSVVRDGFDETQPHRQRYRCKACAGRFDDLTGTVLAGHHQPLRVWVLCLYFMGLNLSNRQIAQECQRRSKNASARRSKTTSRMMAAGRPVRGTLLRSGHASGGLSGELATRAVR